MAFFYEMPTLAQLGVVALAIAGLVWFHRWAVNHKQQTLLAQQESPVEYDGRWALLVFAGAVIVIAFCIFGYAK